MKLNWSVLLGGAFASIAVWGYFRVHSEVVSFLTTMERERLGLYVLSPTTTNRKRAKAFPPSPFHFSACLLMRDDNVILPEWLAYHWEVLPLETLIIALDPFSLTSPDYIVQKFEENLGMNITIWRDADYLFNGSKWYESPATENSIHRHKVAAYLWRQRVFMTQCCRELKRRGKSWTVLIDTDEYLTFNRFNPLSEIDHVNKCKGARRMSSLCRNATFREEVLSGKHPRNHLPLVGVSNKTVAQYIHEQTLGGHPIFNDPMMPCFVIPRILFGPNETESGEVRKAVPDGLDPMSYHTLRFRTHQDKLIIQNGKSLFDVRRFPMNRIVNNPHKVLPRFCLNHWAPDYTENLFRVNHYTGSFDTFKMHRGDNLSEARASWAHRTNFEPHATEHDMSGWLSSFVDRVGIDTALMLTVDLRQWAIENDYKMFPKSRFED